MTPRYLISQQAREDIDEIWHYTATRWDFEQAERVMSQFKQRFQLLAEHPQSGRRRPDLGPGLRSTPVGSFVVVYSPTEFGVAIVHVIHGRRRPGSPFQAE